MFGWPEIHQDSPLSSLKTIVMLGMLVVLWTERELMEGGHVWKCLVASPVGEVVDLLVEVVGDSEVEETTIGHVDLGQGRHIEEEEDHLHLQLEDGHHVTHEADPQGTDLPEAARHVAVFHVTDPHLPEEIQMIEPGHHMKMMENKLLKVTTLFVGKLEETSTEMHDSSASRNMWTFDGPTMFKDV
ncbi:uncharacterized protein LOC123536196 isoform X1 [Mercenaria mercenaria]|uniref:uncharacterized protein LOC123536196 isoform X1 n=1 Tax=Mercenaria mercenaria TaxID=6596 RepID=UPI001E1DEDCC|nr:uncharacterized protein LOC123536196 isoform X1 [Mercenaria mercenaria]